jgi:hypothetical protein
MVIRNVNQRSYAAALIVFILIMAVGNSARAAGSECEPENLDGPASIERIHLGAGKGEGYRMTYCIDVSLGVYWQFKTDFSNEFLTDNPHIDAHRFVGRQGNVVLTENRYNHDNKRLFRWQTNVYARNHRLEFKLVNPEQAGQEFHSGTIRLEARGNGTVVHQTARFRFSGATLWAFYPWRGGMRSFLTAFVRWEQQTAVAWQPHYEAQLRKLDADRLRMKQVFSVNARYPNK